MWGLAEGGVAANLFSVATHPLQILERLPAELRARRWVGLATSSGATSSEATSSGVGVLESLHRELVLPLGVPAVDSLLPAGGLARGAVVELAVQGSMALGTRLALMACRAAQRAGGEQAWCGFVDPSGTLHAPGVVGAGVSLERLIVVRPQLEMLSRVTLRMAEARTCSVLVVDTVGIPHQSLDVHLGPWVRVVRRLGLAVQGTESTVLLLTDQSAPRPLVLPVTQRIELRRASEQELLLAITKDTQGRLAPPRSIEVRRLYEDGLSGTRPGLSSPKRRRMAGAA